MKKIYKQQKLCFLLLLCIAFVSCGKSKIEPKEVHDGDEVYICTGRYSKKYHSTDECIGLKSCKASVINMPVENARDHYKPCRKCVKQ